MGFRAKQKVTAWTFELDQWAMWQNRGVDGVDRVDAAAADYALGVMCAVGACRRECAPLSRANPSHTVQMLRGYDDAKALIEKAFEQGVVPTGSIEELLSAAREVEQPSIGR
jgi:hypothetical protein